MAKKILMFFPDKTISPSYTWCWVSGAVRFKIRAGKFIQDLFRQDFVLTIYQIGDQY